MAPEIRYKRMAKKASERMRCNSITPTAVIHRDRRVRREGSYKGESNTRVASATATLADIIGSNRCLTFTWVRFEFGLATPIKSELPSICPQ